MAKQTDAPTEVQRGGTHNPPMSGARDEAINALPTHKDIKTDMTVAEGALAILHLFDSQAQVKPPGAGDTVSQNPIVASSLKNLLGSAVEQKVGTDSGMSGTGGVKALKDGGGKVFDVKPSLADSIIRNVGESSAVHALTSPLSTLAGAVAKSLADNYFQRPTGGDMKKPDIVRAPQEHDTTKLNTLENKKKERLDKVVSDLKEGLPESLDKTKELVENIQGLLTGQPINADTVNTLRDLSQAAAAELKDGGRAAKEKLEKLSEELRQDYGIDLKIDESGLSMTDGDHTLVIDSKGNVVASSRPVGGEDAQPTPENAEEMIAAMHRSFNMNSHSQQQMIKAPINPNDFKGGEEQKPLERPGKVYNKGKENPETRELPVPTMPDVTRVDPWKNPIKYAGAEVR